MRPSSPRRATDSIDQPAPTRPTNFNAGVTRAIGLLAVIGILFVVWRSAGPSSAMAWHDNVDDAIVAAQQKGKPILAFFTADWCGPCQSFKQNVLTDAGVARALESRFVLVKIDLTEGTGAPAIAAQQLGVRSIPTLIVYDAGGQHIDTASGGMSPAQLIQWLDQCESRAR